MTRRVVVSWALASGYLAVAALAIITLSGIARSTADKPNAARTTVSASAPSLEDGTGAAIMDAHPASSARSSARRHGGGRGGLAAMSLELMGSQLMAELSSVKPQIEKCLRGTRAGVGGPADAVALIRYLKTSGFLQDPASHSREQEALLRELETAAAGTGGTAAQRTLNLDVETRDGEVRIVDVPPATSGSADDPLLICAQKALGGRIIPVPGATKGRRIPVALPLQLGSDVQHSEPESALQPAVERESP